MAVTTSSDDQIMPDATAGEPEVRHPAVDNLRQAAIDTERHVAGDGWDQPVRMFALVRTSALLQAQPDLYDELQSSDPGSLTAIEQEDLPSGDLETMLSSIIWPPEVDGMALAVERIVVPPDAERDLPDDTDAALEMLMAHPGRRDVRLLVAADRLGGGICLLRQREHDRDDAVAIGEDIATGLLAAVRSTLDPLGEDEAGA